MARKFRYPTQVPRGMSAEEMNEQERAENLRINQANIYRQPGAPELQSDPSQEIQRRLAMAFGYDPTDPPPLKQLMDKFHQQSPQVQAGMFEKGIAPVSAATGEKMLHAVGKNRADVQEEAIDTVGKRIRSGEIVSETVNGKPQFFDMVTEEIEDPKNPLQTKKIKKKVPVDVGTLENISMGVRQGRIQNQAGKWEAESEILKPERSAQSRMSAEEFQKILDMRATGAGSLDPINQSLPPRSFESRMPNPDSRGNIFDPSVRPIPSEDFGQPLYNPSTQRIPTPLTSAPAIASSLTPKPQANLGWLGSGGPARLAENTGTNLRSAGNTYLDLMGASANILPNAYNKITKFLEGDRAHQFPTVAPRPGAPRPIDEYDYDVNAGTAW